MNWLPKKMRMSGDEAPSRFFLESPAPHANGAAAHEFNGSTAVLDGSAAAIADDNGHVATAMEPADATNQEKEFPP